MDDLRKAVERYFEKRKYVKPDSKDALLWLTTEVGELVDAHMRAGDTEWVRNNPDKAVDLQDEVADVLMMLVAFCVTQDIDPVKSLERKMKKYVDNIFD